MWFDRFPCLGVFPWKSGRAEACQVQIQPSETERTTQVSEGLCLDCINGVEPVEFLRKTELSLGTFALDGPNCGFRGTGRLPFAPLVVTCSCTRWRVWGFLCVGADKRASGPKMQTAVLRMQTLTRAWPPGRGSSCMLALLLETSQLITSGQPWHRKLADLDSVKLGASPWNKVLAANCSHIMITHRSRNDFSKSIKAA